MRTLSAAPACRISRGLTGSTLGILATAGDTTGEATGEATCALVGRGVERVSTGSLTVEWSLGTWGGGMTGSAALSLAQLCTCRPPVPGEAVENWPVPANSALARRRMANNCARSSTTLSCRSCLSCPSVAPTERGHAACCAFAVVLVSGDDWLSSDTPVACALPTGRRMLTNPRARGCRSMPHAARRCGELVDAGRRPMPTDPWPLSGGTSIPVIPSRWCAVVVPCPPRPMGCHCCAKSPVSPTSHCSEASPRPLGR